MRTVVRSWPSLAATVAAAKRWLSVAKDNAMGVPSVLVSFQVDAKMDLAAEREYMFDHVYRQQQKRFYNTNMHGVDWDKMTDRKSVV